MNEYLEWIFTLGPALVEGALLGAIFFMGLWWTVRKLDTTKHVAFWFLGSFLVRTSIVLLGFYFLLGDNWLRLLAGLLGFVIARIIVTRFIRINDKSPLLLQRASHES
jgi:F1F0 ATPase subunit 2